MSRTSALHHAGVLLLPENLTDRRGDLTGGHDARGHLVQQRLEQVVVGPVDDGDVDVGVRQVLGGEQSAETSADDDDVVASTGGTGRGGCHGIVLLVLHTSPGAPGVAYRMSGSRLLMYCVFSRNATVARCSVGSRLNFRSAGRGYTIRV
jgi:hypothetical protein